jgi:hypothetical protein
MPLHSTSERFGILAAAGLFAEVESAGDRRHAWNPPVVVDRLTVIDGCAVAPPTRFKNPLAACAIRSLPGLLARGPVWPKPETST